MERSNSWEFTAWPENPNRGGWFLKATHRHESQSPRPARCQTPAPGRQICRPGRVGFLGFPRGRSRAGRSPYLLGDRTGQDVSAAARMLFCQPASCATVAVNLLPTQDCCPDFRLYPAVHMQDLVVGDVGRHSWEQSPLLLLHRLIPAERGKKGDRCENRLLFKTLTRSQQKSFSPFCTSSS